MARPYIFILSLTLGLLLGLPSQLMAADSESGIRTLLSKVQDLSEKGDFSYGKYVQGGLFAQLGAGVNQQLALVALGPKDKKVMAAYCVGGQGIATSAGVGIVGEAGQTLGCKSVSDYSGAFLSISVGGRFFLGANAIYSLGLDVHALFNHLNILLEYAPDSDREKFKKDLSQMIQYMSDNNQDRPEIDMVFMILNYFAPGLIDEKESELIEERLGSMAMELSATPDSAETFPSLGGRVKRSLEDLEKLMKANDQSLSPFSAKFLRGLSSFFTGCDSVGLGGDAGLSVGGGVALQVSDYIPMSTIDYRYVDKLDRAVNPIRFKDPSLKDISYTTALKEMARFTKDIALASYRCSVKAQANTMGYIGQAKSLLQKKPMYLERVP